MVSDQLSELLEGISLEFVMIDSNDDEEIRSLITQFENFGELAKNLESETINDRVSMAVEILGIITSFENEEKDKSLDEISRAISEIQHEIKNINSENNDEVIQEESDVNEHKEVYVTRETELKEDAQKEVDFFMPETGLVHPGKLPAHLDEESFAQFLAHQENVLVRMEELILEYENTESEEPLAKLQRVFHTLKGEAGFLNLEEVENVCHSTEDILESKNSTKSIDSFLKVKDWLNETFSHYKGEREKPESLDFLKLDDVPEIADKKNISKGRKNTKIDLHESINVNARRLDRMLDMIGELVIAESILTQNSEIKQLKSTLLMRDFSVLTKITKELQEIGLSLRMVPIKSTFTKMSRIVRDIAKKSGKVIKFSMQGEDSELDKNIVDKIGDPLLHIVRNAVDHGIENPDERKAAGKDETASIGMRAYQRSGFFHIEIEDDGRGMIVEELRKKAVEMGLFSGDYSPEKQEVINLIFEPGFSTSEIVTDISGRGVGMDVVKSRIEELRGNVIVDSKEGFGTLFNISIPLTLAIIDGMVIRVGKERYIIPSLSIVTSNRLEDKLITNVMNREKTIDVQGELLPLINLGEVFGIEEENNQEFKLYVVVEEDGQKAAVVVDELLGKQQIVVKNLGEGLMKIRGISGGAIMPDGLVGLILDVSTLIDIVKK